MQLPCKWMTWGYLHFRKPPYVYIYIYTHIYTHIHKHYIDSFYVFFHVYIYIFTYIHTYMYMYYDLLCMYLCIYIYSFFVIPQASPSFHDSHSLGCSQRFRQGLMDEIFVPGHGVSRCGALLIGDRAGNMTWVFLEKMGEWWVRTGITITCYPVVRRELRS